MRRNNTWLIWIGGIIGLLAIGLVRFSGKKFGVAGLAAGMILVAVCTIAFLLKVVVPRMEERDRHGKHDES